MCSLFLQLSVLLWYDCRVTVAAEAYSIGQSTLQSPRASSQAWCGALTSEVENNSLTSSGLSPWYLYQALISGASLVFAQRSAKSASSSQVLVAACHLHRGVTRQGITRDPFHVPSLTVCPEQQPSIVVNSAAADSTAIPHEEGQGVGTSSTEGFSSAWRWFYAFFNSPDPIPCWGLLSA